MKHRRLPLAPRAAAPLADTVRPADQVRPIYAVWELTLRCDLGCQHCGSRAGHARADELTTEQCLDVVAQLAELGVREVTLIGGEAYLRPDWLDIIRAIRGHGMDCTMTTGGRGMSRERAEGAAAAGLMSCSVSIDGPEAVHDRLRGLVGSHRAACEALAQLRAVGVPVSVNTQINRWTWRHLPEVLELLIERRAHSWQFAMTVPMGRAADHPELLLEPYDLLEVFPAIASLYARADANGIRMFTGNNIGYFGPHEELLRRHMPQGHTGSCGAGRSVIGIEADGTIKGCPSLQTDAWGSGSVRDSSLSSIWERALPLRYTRDRSVDDLWGYCKTCYYAEQCLAGCTWTAHSFFGKPGNNPYCHHRAIELARAGLRERLERVQHAPGTPFDHALFRVITEPLPSAAAERAASP
jgi:radical SAM protein with 4Fe4S-binding SPASM domain